MKVVVIGGSGFLGRTVTDVLRKQNIDTISTHHTNIFETGSLRYDLLSGVVPSEFSSPTIDAFVLTTKVEQYAESRKLEESLLVLLGHIANKRLIYISSDAVFDGTKGFYKESDIPNPQTTYGKNKLLCEKLIQEHCKNYCIIRPSYIYGYSIGILDKRLQKDMDTIKNGGSVEAFGDMYKSPIEVNLLSEIIAEQVASNYIGILHAGGARMSVYDFKKYALEMLGISTDSLVKTFIPFSAPPEMLKDTSLDSIVMRGHPISKLGLRN